MDRQERVDDGPKRMAGDHQFANLSAERRADRLRSMLRTWFSMSRRMLTSGYGRRPNITLVPLPPELGYRQEITDVPEQHGPSTYWCRL